MLSRVYVKATPMNNQTQNLVPNPPSREAAVIFTLTMTNTSEAEATTLRTARNNRFEVYSEILDLVDRVRGKGLRLVLSGFALGKGQELYALLRNSGIDVSMDTNVDSLNRILLGVGNRNDGDVMVADLPPRVEWRFGGGYGDWGSAWRVVEKWGAHKVK